MNVDSFLKTGKTHNICQDYILTSDNFIVLSDGCSGAQNAEIGSMVLCLTAQNLFKRYYGQMDFKKAGELIIHNAEMAVRVLKGPKTCLDATLLMAIKQNNNIHVSVYGDGVIIWIDNNNEVHYINIDFENEKPFYLSYQLDPKREKVYRAENIKKTIITGILNSSIGSMVGVEENFDYGFHKTFDVNSLNGLFISSDGINSFHHDITLDDSIFQVTNFKRTHGEFLKRRMKRFIKDVESSGNWHADDISIGGFMKK